MVENIAAFFVGIGFVGRVVECRMVDKVVVAMMVVDRMGWYFGKVDLG